MCPPGSPDPPPQAPQAGEGVQEARLDGAVSRGLDRFHHSPNTHSMVWLRMSRSSGVNTWRPSAMRLSPDRIATYCLPPASKVIGGALKPVPTLIFQSCSMVVSS